MKFIIMFCFSILCAGYGLADGHSRPNSDHEPAKYVCTIWDVIEVDETFDSRSKAQDRCDNLNIILDARLCRVGKISRYKYRAYFKKKWTFRGASHHSFLDAKWIALEGFNDFALNFGFSNKLPHSLTYSPCSNEDHY